MKLTRTQIKWIAMITMLIDHFTEVVIGQAMLSKGILFPIFVQQNLALIEQFYWLFRAIGRVAFPVFAFFIVEGFFHTSNRLKYACRLFVFTLLSEIPFDMAFNGGRLEWGYQNVYVTLLLGLGAIWLMDTCIQKWGKGLLGCGFSILAVALLAYLANWINCDYGYMGVLTIAVMYLFRFISPVLSMGAGVLLLTILNHFEIFAVVDLWVIQCYDGTKGKEHRYLFYFFYPVH